MALGLVPLATLLFHFAIAGTRLPDRTLVELANAPRVDPPAREMRHEKRPPSIDASLRIGQSVSAVRIERPRTLAAPPLAKSFFADSSSTVLPGDAAGAVGLDHVVTMTNAGMIVHDRNGARVVQLTQDQFWTGSEHPDYYFDPRIVFDAVAKRWIAMAIHVVADEDRSALMIAASATADPTGTWRRYRVPHPHIDFTRLALTRDTVVLSTWHNGGEHSIFFSIDKAHLYSGPNDLQVRMYDNPQFPIDIVPVHAPSSPIEYVVRTTANAILVNRLDRLDQPWTELRHDVTSLSEFAPLAPQPGTSQQLDTGYDDVYAAVMHGRMIYAVRQIVLEGRTSILWMAFDPENTAIRRYALIDDPQTFHAFPSLAANNRGEVLLSYAKLSTTSFPSAEYVLIHQLGMMSEPGMVKQGEGAILNTNRYGDYTTAVVDPRNGRDFWTIQMYGTSTNTWGTWWAQLARPAGKTRSARR